MKTNLIIEQHFHGAFGIDFNRAPVYQLIRLTKEIYQYGIGGIFPTIVTDSIENTKQAISNIKDAARYYEPGMAKILGIHLEGIFLNPEKKGIHNNKYFLHPCVENFKEIEDDFIKIVTLAPELSEDSLINYLHEKKIKVQAGHCVGGDLSKCDGVTHTFNAMSPISHRGESTALSALINDYLYTEIIADGVHVSDDCLKLLFKSKPLDRIILVSDCLPCTKSDIKEFTFAGEKIFYNGQKATSQNGTLAGSTMLLPDIIKRLSKIGLMNTQYIDNPYNYHNIEPLGTIEWDENFNVLNIN